MHERRIKIGKKQLSTNDKIARMQCHAVKIFCKTVYLDQINILNSSSTLDKREKWQIKHISFIRKKRTVTMDYDCI